MGKSELAFDKLIQIGWQINDYGSPELSYQDCQLAILDPIIKPLELWVTRVGARTLAQYQILIHKPMTIHLPFAQSVSSIVNFKLLIERRVQPQPLQDVLLQR